MNLTKIRQNICTIQLHFREWDIINPEAPTQRQKLVNVMSNDDWNIGLRWCPEKMSS